jgi:glucoamylase
MPLVWGHAEYIKLLRSAADGRPFDLIPVVAERYLSARGRKDLEVWKPTRQVTHIASGQTLRIQAPQPFRLRWCLDRWETARDADSEGSGLGINFVDVPGQFDVRGSIHFTFFWLLEDRWLGRDYEVEIRSSESRARTAALAG